MIEHISNMQKVLIENDNEAIQTIAEALLAIMEKIDELDTGLTAIEGELEEVEDRVSEINITDGQCELLEKLEECFG